MDKIGKYFEASSNAFLATLDKNKFIEQLSKKPDMWFIPIEDSVKLSVMLNQNKKIFEDKSYYQEEFYTPLSLIYGWRLNKKIFTLPKEVVKGFFENKESEYIVEKRFTFPSSILQSIPYWTCAVNIDLNINVNLEDMSGTASSAAVIGVETIVFGLRKNKGKPVVSVLMLGDWSVKDGEAPLPLEADFEYVIEETGYPSVMELVSNPKTANHKVDRPHANVFISVMMGGVIDLIMYIASMNKHSPSPYSNASSGVRRMGNKLTLPNPKVEEVLIGDFVIKEVVGKRGNGSPHSSRKTHIRKGHWRRQWYGPKSNPELRTMDLIFIPPCLVRGFNED